MALLRHDALVAHDTRRTKGLFEHDDAGLVCVLVCVLVCLLVEIVSKESSPLLPILSLVLGR